MSNTINNVIEANNHLGRGFMDNALLSRRLAQATKGYSLEAVKSALTQSTLNEESIRAILIQQKLEGEILETTTAEILQAQATNNLEREQREATVSTGGLGFAFDGLSAKVKKAGTSFKTFMMTNPVGWIMAIVTAMTALGAALEAIKDARVDTLDELTEKYDEQRLYQIK